MSKIMNKLVRDKIPEICVKNRDIPTYHVLDDEEYQEILGAETKEDILEEMC